MPLHFEKYQGLGNDFIVVEAATADALTAEQAVRLCDRHFGLGGDGVLLLSPDVSGAPRMTVLNADGSRPEMCGNGLRCVALHVARRGGEERQSFTVMTDAGARDCVVDLKDEETGLVSTHMGVGKSEGETTEQHDGELLHFARINMGNPHAICFHEPISDESLDRLGPRLSARIPGGTNVEIVTQLSPTELHCHVWERGVGRTLACGTGAAATAVAAVLLGRSPKGSPITVHLPGGPLTVTVSESLGVTLRGPAAWVMSGTTKLVRRLPGAPHRD